VRFVHISISLLCISPLHLHIPVHNMLLDFIILQLSPSHSQVNIKILQFIVPHLFAFLVLLFLFCNKGTVLIFHNNLSLTLLCSVRKD
jgi:hypothetical protein